MEKRSALRQPTPLTSGKVETKSVKNASKQVNRTAVPPRGAFSAQMLRPPSTPSLSMDSPLELPMRPEDGGDFSASAYEYSNSVLSSRSKNTQVENQVLSPPPLPPPYRHPVGGKVVKTTAPRSRSSAASGSPASPRGIAKSKQASSLAESPTPATDTQQNAMKPTPSVHPIDTLSKKLRQQAKELTQVYEELEKQNLQIDKYKRQIKSHKRELEQLRAQQAKAAENDSKARNSKTVALEQKKRAAQMMIGTPSTGASLGQKREELDRKLKDAERERKKYELAAKRIETALVDLRVFQNDRMENMLSGAKTSKPGQDATSANDLETVLNEQRAYIRVLEEAVHLKATEFEITGHEELLVVLAELRHTIYQQEKEVDEKNHAVAALQDQLELEQQNHAVTKELMATLQRKQEDAVQHSHEQESELHTQIDEMRSQLQRQEEQIRQFRDMSNDAQRSEETLQSRLNASAKSQNLTEAKLEDATRSIRALEDATRSIRALEEQLKAVSTQCEEAKHQAAGLKEECTKKQSHLDEMNALQEEMLGSVDEYAGKLKKAHEKVERLEEELEAYHQNEVRARKQMEEAERTADEKMKDLRSKIEAAEHQEQKVQAQCTALQHEKNQLESKLAEVQQNLEDQIQESSTQQQALAASESKCRQVEEMTVELEAALSTALQMMVEKPTDNFEPGQENQLGDGNSDGQEFLLDPSVLFELRVCYQALGTLPLDQASLHASLCPSLPEIITRVRAIGERMQTEVTRSLASWARERSNLLDACSALELTTQLCQHEMEKRHDELLDYRYQLKEKISEIELFVMQIDQLNDQIQDAKAEVEDYHELQLHCANQETALESKQRMIQELTLENDRLAEVESAYSDQITTIARLSQQLEDQELAMREQQEYADELENGLETAAALVEQQNESNQQLSANISQVEKSQQEQMDQIKTLQVQNSTFVTHFTRVVKQYLSFLRPIAATDRDLHDSLSQLKSGVENGDIAALLQLFPALVEEYIANCSAAHNQDVSKASKPIDNRKARKQKLQQVEVAVPKWQIPSDMELSPDKSDKQFPRAEEEESPFAEQLQLIRDAFQSYKR